MPNWEDMARQMTVPFGGIQSQPQQPRPDMNALATGMANPFGVQSSVGPSTASFGPNQMYEAWPMSLAKIMVGMLTNKINPAEVWQGFKQSAVNPPQGGIDMRKAADSAFESAMNVGTGNLPFMGGLMAGKNALKAPLGKGVTAYHSTGAEPFAEFDFTKGGQSGFGGMGLGFARGAHFTTREGAGYGPNVLKAELDIKNPLVINVKELKGRNPYDVASENLDFKKNDSVAIKWGDGSTEYIVFDNKKINQIAWEMPDGSIKTLSGRQPKSGLSLAEELAAKGADADEIWNKTGWRSDPKGNWAFEIDDSKMKLLLNKGDMKWHPVGSETTLEYAISYPNLFEQYAKLKKTGISFSKNVKNSNYNPKTDIITIKSTGNIAEMRKDLIHEIQHAIQEIEGWPKGTNQQMAGGLKEYKNTYGEFQARDAASRADWTAEQRKMVRPYSSEMEPKEGWIFKK